MNKKIIVSFITGLLVGILILYIPPFLKSDTLITPLSNSSNQPVAKPLNKYTFQNLKNRSYQASYITLGDQIADNPIYSSYIFYFNSDGKKVAGLANIPKNIKNAPVIIMIRGFVDKNFYTTGTGTQHAGEVLAENGYITLAPDFLGYGRSDNPSKNVMEERFQTYTAVLNLLASLKNLPSVLSTLSTPSSGGSISTGANTNNVGLWAHSNGGQIALSILAISGKDYPTVLWAPVSKPFPYSILYYTDEFDDHGKLLRKAVADFEKDYDAEKYSPPNYFKWIKAPIQLHQGSQDDAVPQKWSDDLYKTLKDLNIDITYFTYPGQDHNFANGSWNTVINRNIVFFDDKLK